MKKKMNKAQLDNRRYYLHRIVSKQFPVNAEQRSVNIKPYSSFSEIPVPMRYYVGQLIKMGYNVQLSLF